MKKILTSLSVVLLVIASVIFIRPDSVSAATEKCYTIKSGNTDVYSDTGLTNKYGSVYDTDEVTILEIKEKYSKVEYPVSNGRTKTGYIHTSAILTSITGTSYQARSAVATYRRPNGDVYGNIDKDDIVLVYGKSGSYTQVRYPVSGGYKYAFIKTSDAENYILNGSQNAGSPIADISGDANSAQAVAGAGIGSSVTVADGIYKVVSGIDSRYVWDIDDASTASGANLQIYKDNGTAAQKFRFEKQSDGYYKITNIKSGKVIDCDNAGKSNGTNIQQYTSNNTSAQRWRLIESGNGYYYIQCKCNNLYVDVKDGKAGNKKNIQMYRGNQTKAQKFKLTAVTDKTSSGNIAVDGVTLDYKLGDYFTDNGKACKKCHNGHSGNYATNEKYCNCKCTAKIGNKTYKLGSIQCLGFARYVQSALYGTNSYLATKSFKRTGSVSKSKLTASKIKSMITRAGVGAHIRTGSSAHSMIVTEVTEKGFTIIQCNGSNNDNYKSYAKCRIGKTTYTWAGYVKSTYGKRGIAYIETYKK